MGWLVVAAVIVLTIIVIFLDVRINLKKLISEYWVDEEDK
jgi:hypothetical protein